MFASLFSLLGVYSTLTEFLDEAREKFLTQPFHWVKWSFLRFANRESTGFDFSTSYFMGTAAQ